MKFFLQMLVAVVALVGLFFLLGFVLKSQSTSYEIEVNAPPEICWNVFHDKNKIPLWLEGIESITQISGTDMTVGSKQEIKMKNSQGSTLLGDASNTVRTVLQSTPHSLYSYDYTNEVMNGNAKISFVAKDSTTLIQSENSFRAKKLWVRSTLFLLQSSMKNTSQAQFVKLKELIEIAHQAKLNEDSLMQIDTIQQEN